MKKLNTYKPSIDPIYSENDQELGIDLISNVVNPAVKIRGVAFENHNENTKNLRFKDDLKLRIAAPVLVPDDIYRNDPDEKYFMRFTADDIIILAKDFMSKLTSRGKDVFNYDHKDEMVDSYILEAIIVDSDSKVDMIKSDYGIEVPVGTFFIVQQFTDKKRYEEIVKSGATSFSFQGFLGTELIQEFKFESDVEKVKKVKNMKMKKTKKLIGVKRVFMSASKKLKFSDDVAENEDLIIIAEDFVEGADVVVVEDVTEGSIEDYTGEVDVEIEGEDKILIIEDGKISEIVEGDEEVKEEDVKVDVEMEDDKKDEKEVELEDEVITESIDEATNELEEIYKILADIKAELAEIKASNILDSNDDLIVDVSEQRFHSALTSFNTKFNNKK